MFKTEITYRIESENKVRYKMMDLADVSTRQRCLHDTHKPLGMSPSRHRHYPFLSHSSTTHWAKKGHIKVIIPWSMLCLCRRPHYWGVTDDKNVNKSRKHSLTGWLVHLFRHKVQALTSETRRLAWPLKEFKNSYFVFNHFNSLFKFYSVGKIRMSSGLVRR